MKLECIRFIFLVLLLTQSALADDHSKATVPSDGVGTRGGAEVVKFNHRPALRELHDKTVCEWGSSEDISKTYLPFISLMNRIERKDPYLALRISYQFSVLELCFVRAPLRALPPSDLKVVTRYLKDQTRQIAIRLNNVAYIDQELFSALPDEEKALLFVHESSHGLLPINVPNRSAKITSFSRMLNSIESFSREKLLANIKGNEVQVGWVEPSDWPLLKGIFSSAPAGTRATFRREHQLLLTLVKSFPDIRLKRSGAIVDLRRGLPLDGEDVVDRIQEVFTLRKNHKFISDPWLRLYFKIWYDDLISSREAHQ